MFATAVETAVPSTATAHGSVVRVWTFVAAHKVPLASSVVVDVAWTDVVVWRRAAAVVVDVSR